MRYASQSREDMNRLLESEADSKVKNYFIYVPRWQDERTCDKYFKLRLLYLWIDAIYVCTPAQNVLVNVSTTGSPNGQKGSQSFTEEFSL